MGFKAETRRIGPYEYKVTQMGAIKGRAVSLRLIKCFLPFFTEVMQGEPVKGKSKKKIVEEAKEGKIDLKNLEWLGSALSKLELNEDDLTYLCDAFSPLTFVMLPDGRNPRLDHIFDEHFAGHYVDLVKWLIFCVQVNFADFTDAALSAGSAAPNNEPTPMGAQSSKSPFPTASTGSSGAS